MNKKLLDEIYFSAFHNDEKEMQGIIDVWYTTSLVCHDFVDRNFWHACKDDMRNEYIPAAETMVAKYKGKVIGFISLVDNTLAAIFLLPDYHGKGVGQALLANAFEKRDRLSLTVYEKNMAARNFYLKHGFTESNKSVDEHTGEVEITMEWNAV
ncbi:MULTISPECIES: GNAT family N-acetyltransferase [Pectobacterium]|uniref:N-acetyltransferase domain-containing protein n=1 Tax=Pectobacterium odoriferum TaxID=78398 RepID=A0ABD6VJM3_9GAMM|nr:MULTISPECIES: GNAT family N-acetyltransferase [Pectobacterium]MBA0187147.1 GNAT family N-acetyltransferase [Pectobacterium odoriferum]MCA6962980.1 GNAT family N-acetyltransferase [Pectobacterium odoriferum]MCH5011068.1 GNAT family N-acetyltransferase [Pectobacterium odoriferum]POD91458.1 hypothetical protein BVY06_21345 [Pectobacterium odoriferum]POD91480.1 hypothetical protein BV925_12850 [Pectobacterium odoriferum]